MYVHLKKKETVSSRKITRVYSEIAIKIIICNWVFNLSFSFIIQGNQEFHPFYCNFYGTTKPFLTASVSIKLPILNILYTYLRFEKISSSLDTTCNSWRMRDFQNSQSQNVIFLERAKDCGENLFFKNKNSIYHVHQQVDIPGNFIFLLLLTISTFFLRKCTFGIFRLKNTGSGCSV